MYLKSYGEFRVVTQVPDILTLEIAESTLIILVMHTQGFFPIHRFPEVHKVHFSIEP